MESRKHENYNKINSHFSCIKVKKDMLYKKKKRERYYKLICIDESRVLNTQARY